ncbi:RHS repeat-associated core domain-containing protein [Micromonospora sp. NPDC047620]|uniref:RHS repeat domain-containing protein n=2 Tax=Bacillati TaxID=1783272 RepID=UPI00371C2DF0
MRVVRTGLLVAALVAATVTVPGARDGQAAGRERPGPLVAVAPRGEDISQKLAVRKAPAITWPEATRVEVRRTAASSRAGALPLWVSAADGGAGTVTVEVADRAATAKAQVRGMVVRVRHAPAAGAKPGRSKLELDYSGFRAAYGGDYATRLRLVRLPDCALTAGPACGRAQPVASANNHRAARVTAQVTDGTYALTAAPGGAAGSFKPTSLTPSATWQVGLQSGDFSWSYPMRTPQLPGGAPVLALDYSSARVDGRTAATNNQPSWVGEGFESQPGFIERSYQPCADDGQAGIGDLCWASNAAGKPVQSATVSLPGLNSELVRDDATGTWRAEQDGGWRADLLTGAANGDEGDAPSGTAPGDRGEYWRLTSPDGTQFFFGRNRMPGWTDGAAETDSAFTVPVYGNHVGEPCHGASFAVSWCQQAYRWNLDFVVTPHGDVTAYHYERETNSYGRNGSPSAVTPYVRAGNVRRIEYGLRLGSVYSAPAAARVVFTSAERCLPGSACQQSGPADYPDTPLDQACGSTSCPTLAPTFWTTRRLAKVTTQVDDGGYRDVDSWTFTHTFPSPQDGEAPTLWLESIAHTGHAGGTAAMPLVRFDPATTPQGEGTPNRIDTKGDSQPAMRKFRLGRISNETGGSTSLLYTATDCQPGSLPVPDRNTARCYPAYWAHDLETPTIDWFAKYVVSRVTETDRVGGDSDKPKITEYEYLDGGAWHHDDAELVPDAFKSWGQWRGYQKVRVRTGDGVDGPRTLTEHLFLRGMDGDRNADGSTKSVTTDSIRDESPLRGFARWSTVYDGDGPNAAVVSRTVAAPVQLPVTAERVRDAGPLRARVTEVRSVTTTTTVPGGARTTEQRYGYNGHGLVAERHDLGDTADPGDDTCVRTSYAVNDAAWIVNARSREVTVAGDCAGTEVLAEHRYSYDGNSWDTAPTTGDVTEVQEGTETGYVTTQRTTVDAHGRPIEQRDASGDLTRTAYTPGVGGPLAATTVTNPAGHVTTTSFHPLLGQPVTVVDANGASSTSGYDPLGRLTSVWLPGRATTATPNRRYTYLVRDTAASAVTSQELIGSGNTYRTSVELFDGFLRSRQVQQPAPGGGRILTDTRYDSHGRIASTTAPRYDAGTPGTGLVAQPAAVPAQTRFGYDGAGRQSAEVLYSGGVEKWRTTTHHDGDRTSVDPPTGGTATQEIRDARGHPVELRQFLGGAPTGDHRSTRYTYTRLGQLATVTDHAGNVWRYHYDRRGRQTRSETPDAGVRTSTYDDEGRIVTSTDGNGRTLTTSYDALGRRTGLREGGTLLAGWTYDTAANGKGRPATTTRHAATGDIVTAVTGYDPRGRITGTAVTVAEPGLAGTYQTSHVYYEDNQPYTSTLTLPAAASGGLAATETLRYGYDTTGRPTTLSNGYVTATTYEKTGEPKSYTLGAAGRQVIRTFSYDPATRRLTRATTAREGQSPAGDVSYDYDQVGNVTRIADAAGADTQCLRYDGLRRLTEAWTPAAGGCAVAPIVAGLGGPAAYWDQWTFDAAGNRAVETRRSAAGDRTRTYQYPAPGAAQPHTLRSVTVEEPDGGRRTDTYTYDTDGRLLTRNDQRLEWDAEGRLASVTEAGKTSSFGYDAEGNRVLRRDSAGTTLYLGDTELHRAPDGQITGTRYYRHNGEIVAIRRGGALSWAVGDHHGTADTQISAVDLSVTRRWLTPYGQRRDAASPAGWAGDRGFVGGTVDADSGLVHLGARDYDPEIGSFVSLDPVTDTGDPQQIGGYAYGSHNPTTFSDPDGLKTVKVHPGTVINRILTGAVNNARAALDRAGPSSARVEWGSWPLNGWRPLKDVVMGVGPKKNRSSDAAKPKRGSGTSRTTKKPVPAKVDIDWGFEAGGDVITWEDRVGGGGGDWHDDDYYDYDPYDYDTPVVQYQERPCVGWNQCLTPRPIDQSIVWESAAGAEWGSAIRGVPAVRPALPVRWNLSPWWGGSGSRPALPGEQPAPSLPSIIWRLS